jgi:hypothetical protein
VSSIKYDLDNNTVTFNLNKNYSIGQSYKFQLAYKTLSGTGFYSTVAMAKYTSKPEIKIEGLHGRLNKHKYNYIGEYKT